MDRPVPSTGHDPPEPTFLLTDSPCSPIDRVDGAQVPPEDLALERPLPLLLLTDPHTSASTPWAHPSPFLAHCCSGLIQEFLRRTQRISTPDLDGEVVAAGGEVGAARGEGDGPDSGGVRFESCNTGPFVVVRVRGEELDRVVVGSRGEELCGAP